MFIWYGGAPRAYIYGSKIILQKRGNCFIALTLILTVCLLAFLNTYSRANSKTIVYAKQYMGIYALGTPFLSKLSISE